MHLKRLGICLAFFIGLCLPITLAEEWSWGAATEEVSSSPSENSTSSTLDISEGHNSSETEPVDREARFLGFNQKLCSLGIGLKCEKKPYPDAINSHYGPPPIADSSLSTSSYATLDYDNYNKEGHGYPSVPSKASVGGFKPFFVPPKPYPEQPVAKPYPVHPEIQYAKPSVNPTYEAPNPTYKVPKPTYEVPQPAYEVPKPTYNVPKPIHEAPQPAYEVPKPTYNVPKPTYETPEPAYEASKSSNTNGHHGYVDPTAVVHHTHTHTHIYQGVKESTPSGSAVFVSTSNGILSSGKTIDQNSFEGHIHGQTSRPINPSGPGIRPPVPSGNTVPLLGRSGNIGFQTDGQSTSGILQSIPAGVVSSVSTGTFSSATFDGHVSGNIGGHVSGTGLQSSVLPDSSFQSSSGAVLSSASGLNIPHVEGQVGGQNSNNVFHSAGSSASGKIPANVISTGSNGFIHQSSFGGQISGSGFQSTFNTGHGVTVAPINQFPDSIIEVNTPEYREGCHCVDRNLCPVSDIIPRRSSLDISELIDARSRVSDILSNATDIEETEIATTTLPEYDTVIPDSEEESRQKRHTLTYDVSTEDDIVDYQERKFSGYVPGIHGCKPHHVCCRNPIYAPPKQQYTCGKSNAHGVLGRVKNPAFVNDDSEFAEYPWQAAILKLNQGENIYVCGAVLISSRHLLTAAHCLKSLQANTIIVRLGDWDVTTAAEFYQHVEIPVSDVVIHPEYYAGNLQNDIALITLQYSVDFSKNPHITPVCLPEEYDNFIGQRCHSSGWGKDAHGEGGKFQRILKEVEVPVVSHFQCQKSLRLTHLGASFSLHEGNICAGGEEGRDTCEGDGGGPLVCPGHSGNAQLVGLVSWGIGCGKVGIPGVYVNVAHYLDWIRAASH